MVSGLPLLAALLANTAPPEIAVRPSSGPVCLNERQPAYVNVDFVVHNGSDKEIEITEIRALVFDRAGTLIEKRLVWQGALDIIGLGPWAKLPPGTDRVVFNPVHFSSAAPGTKLRYEFDLSGQPGPFVVDIVPRLCRTKARLILPLSGRVSVLDGHDALSHHRRLNYFADWARKEGFSDNPERFALDLVVVDEAGQRFRGRGSRNEDFYGWGQPVRAPADGVVVASHDGQPDNDRIGSENRYAGGSYESSAGNYVLIRHGSGEFSQINHMQLNSLRVRTGDTVHAGQVVGLVGNSGSSLMPHVHYQPQDGPGVRGVHGIPAYFHDLRFISNERVPDAGIVLDSGDIVIAK